MKNVTEIRRAVLKALNTGKEIAADGKLGFDDITKVIAISGDATDAYDDAREYFPEIGVSTNEDMDASDAQVEGFDRAGFRKAVGGAEMIHDPLK